MAKKQPAKTGETTLDTLKPYLERALRDPEFRHDLKEAMLAARELYGPLSKSGSVKASAKVLATDKKAQEQLFRAVEEMASAAGTLTAEEKKKSRKGRKMLLLAGIIAGALYNPWTGPQTREKLLDLIAGDDDLQPLDAFPDLGESAAEAAANGKAAAADAAEDAIADATDAAENVADAADDAS
ncbi:MAG: hypothetical protein ACRC50_10305 [Gaiella sp.]